MTETAKIWAALAAVQTGLRTQPHTRRVETGRYGYTYTELSALCDYLLPLLGAAGLATTYTTRRADDALEIECHITAADGSSVSAATVIAPKSWDAQDVGKVMTYGRRYTLQMATGIATEADDDCQPTEPVEREQVPNPTPKTTHAQKQTTTTPASEDLISEAQKKKIFARVSEIFGGAAPPDEVRAHCTAIAHARHRCRVTELTKRAASDLITYLETATVQSLTADIPF